MKPRPVRHHVCITLVMLWGLTFCATGQGLPTTTPHEVGMSAQGVERIGETVREYIRQKQIAGAVTIVARRGRVVHFEANGMQDIAAGRPMRKDAIFRIYSMTKAIVSVAAMMLVEEGKLKLDAPVADYVPAAARARVGNAQTVPGRGMTVRDLLRHTSGLPNNVTTDRALREAGLPPLHASTLEEMTGRLEHVPLLYEPGKGWHYSFATDVLARLVEVASGQRLDACLEERIFQPLKMGDTAFHVPAEKRDRLAVAYNRDLKPTDTPQPGTRGAFTFEKPPKFLSGGGGLVSTATDYMRFCLMLSGMGEFDGTRLLKPETVAEMTRNQLPAELLPISRPPRGRGFGLGFAVRVETIDSAPSSIGEYEWLGGAGTEFWISPRDELVVITLTQKLPMFELGQALKPVVYDAIREDKYLLLDDRVTGQTENASLTLGTIRKHRDNPLFIEDKPWEPRFDNVYANVVFDAEEQLYKCWYNPFIVDERTTSTAEARRNPHDSPNYMDIKPNRREEGILYATSRDGVHWEKPALGLVEFGGDTMNNILVRGPSGTGVFKDHRERDASRRYKMFFSGANNNIQRVSFSPDGLRWSDPILCPEIEAGGDTHNNAFWVPALGRYVGFMRLWEGHRVVGRTDTSDFVKWTKSRAVLRGDPQRQTHDMVVTPTAGLFIGMVGIMQFPEKDSRNRVRQHVELVWSPDTFTWHPIEAGKPFIGNSTSKTLAYGKMPYDWGGIFPSTPIIGEEEIRLYYGACDWYFFDWRKGGLALATLRADGWAGYEPDDSRQKATLTTTPLVWPKRPLQISADVAPKGWLRIQLLDQDGKVIASAQPIRKTVTNHTLQWANGLPPEQRHRQTLKIRFQFQDAKLYSFRFD